jgi:hypothetical protein
VTDDEALLAREAALQDEAAAVIADLGLFALVDRVGVPVQTGSCALGLMVARDIDVTTLCPELGADGLFEALRPLAAHPRVRRLSFRNDTGRWNTDPAYPDGLYWQVDYASDAGAAWNLDLWFLREGTTQFDLRDLGTLPPRLTREARLTILRIKEALAVEPVTPKIRSHLVYAAVLEHGVRTPRSLRDTWRRSDERRRLSPRG